MSTANSRFIDVEVAYARPEEQTVVSLTVRRGTTVEEAIRLSGLIARFPEIDLKVNKVGIFGELTVLSDTLQAGDRVEIYRPLVVDPKEARRIRAAAAKATRRGSTKP